MRSSIESRSKPPTLSIVHNILHTAMYNVYNDLEKAEVYMRAQEDWPSSTFVMPGGISHDVQRGHELSLTEQPTFVGFLDVAAAMIEVADEEGGRWKGQDVSLVLKGGQKARKEWGGGGGGRAVASGEGLVLSYVPALYSWLP